MKFNLVLVIALFLMMCASVFGLITVDSTGSGLESIGVFNNGTLILSSDISDGLRVTSSNIVIDCNGHSISSKSYAVEIFRANNVTVRNCVVTSGNYGVYAFLSNDNTIYDNDFSGLSSHAIVFEESNSNVVYGNSLSANYYGIYLANSQINEIYSNDIFNNRDSGIQSFGGAHSNMIYDNEIYGNKYSAVYLVGGTGNNVSGNNMYSNLQEVVKLLNGDSNIVGGNTITGGYVGIYTSDDNGYISDNFVKALTGISILGSDNTIYHNDFLMGSTGVIFYEKSSNNLFYLNNVKGNKKSIEMKAGASGNTFTDGSQGNYWCDGTHDDADKNGICDSSYSFDGGVDSYPLVIDHPWEDNDGDGYQKYLDCSDDNVAIYPGASETLNSIDDNCDGNVDELLCGNGVVEINELCDSGAACNAICRYYTFDTDFDTFDMTDNEDGTYDYEFTESNIPFLKIRGNKGVVEFENFHFDYSTDGGIRLEIANLSLNGTTKEVTVKTKNNLCALDTEDFVAGNIKGSDVCEHADVVGWRKGDSNICDQLGIEVVGKDIDGNDLLQYTCEMISVSGVTYSVMRGFSHTLIVGYDDEDEDGYASYEDCDDSDAFVYQELSGYVDDDGDGYTVGDSVTVCTGDSLPKGYVSKSLGGDCDDTDSNAYELYEKDIDNDNDGYTSGEREEVCGINLVMRAMEGKLDCDDDDATVYPGAEDLAKNCVNDAPIVSLIPDSKVTIGETVSMMVVASDPEGDILKYSSLFKDGTLELNVFTWVPNVTGVYDIDFVVSDGGFDVLTSTKVTVEDKVDEEKPKKKKKWNKFFNKFKKKHKKYFKSRWYRWRR